MAVLSAIAVFVLILDAQTAINGATAGVSLCVKSVIPSLFPLFFLCGILNSYLAGSSVKLLKPIGKLCGIPSGAESLYLIGITGGYPVGAKCIYQSYSARVLRKEEAERLLGFCSNAGPAFLFGMTSLLFPNPAAPWLLWLIQILCALITGMILPGKVTRFCAMTNQKDTGIAQTLQSALHAIASVCGWVIMFRVLLQFLDRWLLWLFPKEISLLLTGILELSNGCIALHEIENLPLRFIIAAVITVFGGICVCLQTISVCKVLSCRMYFVGKAIQTIICVPMAMIFSSFLFPGNNNYLYIGLIFGACSFLFCFLIIKSKICTGNPAVYRV